MKKIILIITLMLSSYAGLHAAETEEISNDNSIEQAYKKENNLQDATAFTNEMLVKIKETLDNEEKDNKEKLAILIDYFKVFVDTDWMGQYALGDYRKDLDAELLAEFLGYYNKFVIYSYVPKFTLYNGQDVKVVNVSKLSADIYAIEAAIDSDLNVTFRVKYNNDKQIYQLVDVVAQGVGILQTQKKDFTSTIERKSVAKFVKLLGRKVKSLEKRNR